MPEVLERWPGATSNRGVIPTNTSEGEQRRSAALTVPIENASEGDANAIIAIVSHDVQESPVYSDTWLADFAGSFFPSASRTMLNSLALAAAFLFIYLIYRGIKSVDWLWRLVRDTRWPVAAAALALVGSLVSVVWARTEARHAPVQRASVVDLTLSPDGSLIAAAHADGTLEVREAGGSLQALWGDAAVHRATQSVVFDEVDGKLRLIRATADGRVSIHNARTGEPVLSLSELPVSVFAARHRGGTGRHGMGRWPIPRRGALAWLY